MHLSSFLASLPPELQPPTEQQNATLQRLETLWQEAHTAWPELSITKTQFFSYLRETFEKMPPSQGLQQRLERLHAGDLYLVCGCLLNQEKAFLLFESTFATLFHQSARRYTSQHHPVEDLVQDLREKLFVGSETIAPKLRSYAGEGPLKSWLRITATRTYLDRVRRGVQQKREFGDRELEWKNAPALDDDIELGFLKREYRQHFTTAFEAAFQTLKTEHRNLLRQQLIFGLSIDQIGAIYNIHRSTAARRIAKAREHLLHATRKALLERLNISSDEFESIMKLIHSNINLSLSRLLQSQSNPEHEG